VIDFSTCISAAFIVKRPVYFYSPISDLITGLIKFWVQKIVRELKSDLVFGVVNKWKTVLRRDVKFNEDGWSSSSEEPLAVVEEEEKFDIPNSNLLLED
jgi:hypothetical protein